MNSKNFLIEVLEFGIYKLKTDGCTMDEMNSAVKAAETTLNIHGTSDDFAKFYGVSPSNVRATISRKLIAKPTRKVLYPFLKFMKVVPGSWHHNPKD